MAKGGNLSPFSLSFTGIEGKGGKRGKGEKEVRIKRMRAVEALIPWSARAQEEAQALFLNKPCATELESD